MLDIFIIIIIYTVLFVLSFVFWWKVIDEMDKIAQEKLDEDTYNIVICILFVLCIIKIIFN